MSVAPPFIYRQFYPACIMEMTDAELEDLTFASSPYPVYSRWQGTLAECLNLLWNIEKIDVSVTSGSGSFTGTLFYGLDNGATHIYPGQRVCDLNYTWSLADVYEGIDLRRIYIASLNIYKNTDTGLHEIIIGFFFYASDGPDVALQSEGLGFGGVYETTVVMAGKSVRAFARASGTVTYSDTPTYYTYT